MVIVGSHHDWNHGGQILLELENVRSKIIIVQLSLISMKSRQSGITKYFGSILKIQTYYEYLNTYMRMAVPLTP